MSKRKGKRDTPGVMSAAGLIRFYEETDAVITIKPHLLIAICIVLVVMVISLAKVLPLFP
jgi:preprotein translocase subunit Sec61beta